MVGVLLMLLKNPRLSEGREGASFNSIWFDNVAKPVSFGYVIGLHSGSKLSPTHAAPPPTIVSATHSRWVFYIGGDCMLSLGSAALFQTSSGSRSCTSALSRSSTARSLPLLCPTPTLSSECAQTLSTVVPNVLTENSKCIH